MTEMRTVLVPVEKMCHVQYYVFAEPLVSGDQSFVLKNEYFETRAEAEELRRKNEHLWYVLDVREKVTPLED